MPNKKAKDRKRRRYRQNALLKYSGRTANQIKRNIRKRLLRAVA